MEEIIEEPPEPDSAHAHLPHGPQSTDSSIEIMPVEEEEIGGQDHKIRATQRPAHHMDEVLHVQSLTAEMNACDHAGYRDAVLQRSQYCTAIRAAVRELTAQGLVHGKDYMYECSILDTGCQITIVHCSWEQYMAQVKPSRACITGFAGAAGGSKNGRFAGVIYTKFISEFDGIEGSTLALNTNSVPGLAGNLFSVNRWYGKNDSDKRCILFSDSAGESWVKIRRGSEEVLVPCRFCPVTRHWLIHQIIGADVHKVKKAGACVQRHIRADPYNRKLNAKIKAFAGGGQVQPATDVAFLLSDDVRGDMIVDVSALQVAATLQASSVPVGEMAPKMLFSTSTSTYNDEWQQSQVTAWAGPPADEDGRSKGVQPQLRHGKAIQDEMCAYTRAQHGPTWNREVMQAECNGLAPVAFEVRGQQQQQQPWSEEQWTRHFLFDNGESADGGDPGGCTVDLTKPDWTTATCTEALRAGTMPQRNFRYPLGIHQKLQPQRGRLESLRRRNADWTFEPGHYVVYDKMERDPRTGGKLMGPIRWHGTPARTKLFLSYQDDHMYHPIHKWLPGVTGPRRTGKPGHRFPADKYWRTRTPAEVAADDTSRRWDERHNVPTPQFNPDVQTRAWCVPGRQLSISTRAAGKSSMARAVCWHDVLKPMPGYRRLMDTRTLTVRDMERDSPFLRAFSRRVPIAQHWNMNGELGTGCSNCMVDILHTIPNPESYVGWRVAAMEAQTDVNMGLVRAACGAGVVDGYTPRGPPMAGCHVDSGRPPAWTVAYDDGTHGMIDAMVLMCAVVLGGAGHGIIRGHIRQAMVGTRYKARRTQGECGCNACMVRLTGGTATMSSPQQALTGAAVTRSEARRRLKANGPTPPCYKTPPLDPRIGDPLSHVGAVFFRHFPSNGCTYAGSIHGYDPQRQMWNVVYDQTRAGASAPDGDMEELDQQDLIHLVLGAADSPDLQQLRPGPMPEPEPAPSQGGVVIPRGRGMVEPEPESDQMPAPEPESEWDEELGLEPPDQWIPPDESAIRGTKAGMNPRERAMSAKRLHERNAHIGNCPGCKLCSIFRGRLKCVREKVDPHKETRPGYRFHMDVISWSRRNRHGHRYTCAMRCECTGYIAHFHCALRSELPQGVHDMITALRSNPLYQGHPYEICQVLRLDLEGAWSDKSKDFNEKMDALGIKREWTDPQQKSSNGRAEGLMRIIEITTKSCLAQTSMGYEWWGEAVDQAILLRNCYPLAAKISSSDGDAIRPMEELSMAPGQGAKISRRQIDHILHHSVAFGQLCVCFNGMIKGSNIERSKARFGICIGMCGDMPRWWCPYVRHEFKTKQYVEYQMSLGISALRMIGMEETSMCKIALPRLNEKHSRKLKFNMTIDNFAEMIGDEIPSMLQFDGVTRHRGINNVLCEITDENGKKYTADAHGELYLQKLREAMDNTNPTLANRMPRAFMMAKLVADPRWYVRNDTCFYKKFPGQNGEFSLRMGRIKSYRPVQRQWLVAYDTVDSSGLAAPPSDDTELFSAADMTFYVVDAKHAPQPTVANVARSETILRAMQRRTRAELHRWNVQLDADVDAPPGQPPRRGCAAAYLANTYAEPGSDYHALDEAMTRQPDHIQRMYHCMLTTDGPGNIPDREYPTADQWPQQRHEGAETGRAAGYTTKGGETALDVMNALSVPADLFKCYFQWLGTPWGPHAAAQEGGTYFCNPWRTSGKCGALPRNQQTKLPAGVEFPRPAGGAWLQMSHDFRLMGDERKQAHSNLKMAEYEAQLAEHRYRVHRAAMDTKAYQQPAGRDNPDHEAKWPSATYGHAALRKYVGADGRITGCKTITEAERRPDYARWMAAVRKELEAFVRLRVLSHGHTMREIRAKGIKNGVIPWANGLTVKYGPDGMLSKYKSRRYLLGDKRFAHYGSHFTETFSASPNPATTKIMQAMCVLLGLQRRCCDIHTAYLHAECLPGEQCPVRMPVGERKYKMVRQPDGTVQKEELFSIMLRYIYGLPSSDRRYSQMLNRWLLDTFKVDGWTIKKCTRDPCLYVINYPRARYPDTVKSYPGTAGAKSAGGLAGGPPPAMASAEPTRSGVGGRHVKSPVAPTAAAAAAANCMPVRHGQTEDQGEPILAVPPLTAAAGSQCDFSAASTDPAYSSTPENPAGTRGIDSDPVSGTGCYADSDADAARENMNSKLGQGASAAYGAALRAASGIVDTEEERTEFEAMAAQLRNDERGTIWLIVHTDDCDMVGPSSAAMQAVAAKLDERFGVDDGDPTHMLGIERKMSPDGATLELTQTGYVDQLVEEYSMHTTDKYRTTPMPSGTFITRVPPGSVDAETEQAMQREGEVVTKRGYRALVGSLLWLARCTMPELLVCVSMLSKVMCRPTEEAWRLGMWCVEYCRGQRHRGLKFSSTGNSNPICYYDSSNRADVTNGKAQHGHAIFLADAPVLAESKVHKHVGMSASHNEWMALRHAAMNVVWMRELLSEMGLTSMTKNATPCNGDNDATLRFSWEDMITPGNKYYLQEYYFVKEMVNEDVISPRRVPTDLNYADPLTKIQTKGVLEVTRAGLTGYRDGGLPAPAPPPPDCYSWR